MAAKVTSTLSLPSGGTVEIMSDTTAILRKSNAQMTLTHADLGAIGKGYAQSIAKSALGKGARKS